MKKRITITIEPAILKAAKIHAVKVDTNLSALIEKLLREWLIATCASTTITTTIVEDIQS